jgi:hypothetical protein
MFKWSCFALAVVALLGFAWMLNDVRMEIKRTNQQVNERLPEIIARVDQTTATVNQHLPRIVNRAETTAETFAEISEDLKQLKELAGLVNSPRDKNLVSYATSILQLIEAQDAVIGTRKLTGKGLSSPVPAREWAAGARKESLFLTAVVRSRGEYLNRLCTSLLRRTWYIQFDDQDPVPLKEWLKANHPDSKDL